MKAYYFEYQRDEPPRNRKRRLLFGSANATDAGFSGKRNAELIADVNLAIGEDSELAKYFESILTAFDSESPVIKIEKAEVLLSKQPTLLLPTFKCVAIGELPNGFDTWLQRGVLVAQHRNAPQFLTVSIPLTKPLPQDVVARIFADRQFAEKTKRNIVRFGYLNNTDAAPTDDEDETKPMWKSQFAVWTHLGDWTSDQCYRDHANVMKSKTSDERRDKVEELLKNSENETWKAEKRFNFLSALGQVWEDLIFSGVDPKEYLVADAGFLNRLSYEERFDKKLAQDILLANDPEFRSRYIYGYEFPDVPRFRQDTAAWESFVRSWCDSVLLEAAKNRTNSLVTQRIAEVIKSNKMTLEDLSAKELADAVRKSWNKPYADSGYTAGEWVGMYSHADD
ncbi:MAG: hypothetical protein PHV02_10965 [Rhodocyclaceae bacterium]|nr:hypothetical protein [Rhodocyclaceae bacterium]